MTFKSLDKWRPSTILQNEKAKEVGLQIQDITIEVNAILLSSGHLTIRLDLKKHLLEKSVVHLRNPLAFFKFFIFLSVSGSPDVTAGTALRGVLWDAEDCVDSWLLSALASCKQI